MATQTSSQQRQRFVGLLEDSKRSLVADAGGEKGDGPNKLLAKNARIAPSRVREFLDSGFALKIPNDARRVARSRKLIAGFAASVRRTLIWLEDKGRLQPGEITAAALVEAYWPGAARSHFNNTVVDAAIAEGTGTAEGETSNLDKIDNVQLWVVNWGPFDSLDPISRPDMFTTYGTALFKGIDPIGCKVVPYSKKLEDLLNLPPPDPRKPRTVGMGPFETLFRRFGGFRFVTIPALQIPLMGLQISTAEKPEKARFEALLNSSLQTKRIVVDREVGDLVLSSVLSLPARKDPNRFVALPSSNVREIAEALIRETEGARDKHVIFISDALLAFELYVRLSKEGVHVDVVSQWTEVETDFVRREFVFAPGLMLREPSADLAELLDASQKQLFRSHWRVEVTLLDPLFEGMRDWLARLRLDEQLTEGWPDHAPLFLFPQNVLREYLRGFVLGASYRSELIASFCKCIENCIKKADHHEALLRKLFKISPAPTAGSPEGGGQKVRLKTSV
jgi:hypothetical protein